MDALRSFDPVLLAQGQRVFDRLPLELAPHHQAMHPLGQEAPDVEDIGLVVGRGQSPMALLVHQKREVLVVVVRVVGKDIEHHSAEDLLLVALRQSHLATDRQQLLVAVGIGR